MWSNDQAFTWVRQHLLVPITELHPWNANSRVICIAAMLRGSVLPLCARVGEAHFRLACTAGKQCRGLTTCGRDHGFLRIIRVFGGKTIFRIDCTCININMHGVSFHVPILFSTIKKHQLSLLYTVLRNPELKPGTYSRPNRGTSLSGALNDHLDYIGPSLGMADISTSHWCAVLKTATRIGFCLVMSKSTADYCLRV